jgi:PAS domain S-box-containing protein
MISNKKIERRYGFLNGSGELGSLVQAFDWSTTSLGPIGAWPPSLKATCSLILHSKFPMLLWWGKEFVQIYNDSYRMLLGEGKHPAALGQTAFECWKENWHILQPLITKVSTERESVYFEDLLVPLYRNGVVDDAYWTFCYSPVLGDEGNVEGLLVVGSETTSQVMLAVRSERNLRNIICKAPVAMCLLKGEDMVVEIANDKVLEIWDKTSEQVVAKPLFSVLPEAKEQGLEGLLIKVLKTGENFVAHEMPVKLLKNGKPYMKYLNFVYEAYHDEDGQATGVMVVAVEVTEQVIARQAVEASEKVFRNMVLNAPIGICVMNATTRVSEIVNDKFLEVAGKPYEAIAGKFYWDSFAEARPYYEAALTDVIEKGITYYANEVELMLIRHGKPEQIFVTFVYAPIKTINDTVSKVVVWVLENTHQVLARKKVEDLIQERTLELSIANRNLHKSNAELEQFAYITSHDLQEPARKVSTFVEMLNKTLGEDIDPRSKNYLVKIESASTRMLRLIRDVLAISQLSEIGKKYELVDLNIIVHDAISDFELLIEQKRCKISVDRLATINGISIQMSQLFGNLISNALKFSKPNGDSIINIRQMDLNDEQAQEYSKLERGHKYVMISVEDNGIGFSQEYALQIFDIFHRLHDRTEYQGTGIGLAMCKKIVENHGGHIFVKSTPGRGSIFNVILPALAEVRDPQHF